MKIPSHIQQIIDKLEDSGFEAFIVGGCVRDFMRGEKPKDWDITTIAKPEQVLEIFDEAKYENDFGTVILPIKDKDDNLLDVVEITTYRSEDGYSNRRHPDKVSFEDKLEKDLSRRDFTVNALAMKSFDSKLKIDSGLEKHAYKISDYYFVIDLFGGLKDLRIKIIRAVGEPSDRFKEDALRMMRAIRLACQMDFDIEAKTQRGISRLAGSLKFIASERIRDELVKILNSKNPYQGILSLYECKLLQYILPELVAGVGVKQNKHHVYEVFEHNLFSLKFCPNPDWRVRFAALLHDVAKPQAKKIIKGDATFYNHDLLGARITKKIMQRLKFATEDIDKVTTLIAYHMFYYNVGEVTESSVRRLIKKVGKENLYDLIDLRIADRLGSGVPKAKPYKLRHLEYMLKKVQNDPVSVKMLNINGDILLKHLKLEPGPKIGAILDVLLSEVIDDPQLNELEYLRHRSQELNKMDLKALREQAKEKIEGKKTEDDTELKEEFWVK
jgi:poly(A) polymerase/tRNA nucleotidyltransferase (CCA-adding enzyme)